jgi:hypothetical protein
MVKNISGSDWEQKKEKIMDDNLNEKNLNLFNKAQKVQKYFSFSDITE